MLLSANRVLFTQPLQIKMHFWFPVCAEFCRRRKPRFIALPTDPSGLDNHKLLTFVLVAVSGFDCFAEIFVDGCLPVGLTVRNLGVAMNESSFVVVRFYINVKAEGTVILSADCINLQEQ
jgi:hypothetical protein